MTFAATIDMVDLYRLAEARAESEDDSLLVKRCCSGEATAWREVYQRHKLQVYRVVARMVLSDADRDEVVQDVFLHVFKSLPSFRGSSKLSTWVHRVALNVVLQHLRGKRSRIRLDFVGDGELPGGRPSDSDNPESEALLRERQAAVTRSLGKLSPKKRAVLVLHDFEGLAGKEIAEIVGAPLFTVRTRLFYARQEFYGLLAMESAFEGVTFGSQGGK